VSESILDLSRVGDTLFWQGFAPKMHIGDVNFLNSQAVFDIDENAVETARASLKKEGYFEILPPRWGLPISGMADLVVKLEDNGLPTPFSFIYDEFWCLYFRLNKLLAGVLGQGFLRLPDFWTWLVDPKRSQSGWRPHRDKDFRSLFDDRSPKSVTIWIPLTDTDPLNGCMYIVPADRDPTYGTSHDRERRFEYSDIRALPAKAGTVFCWTQAVFHWGSHACERAKIPRISAAFEFQSARVPPYNEPLTNPYEIPNFSFRMRLIAKQILQYQHMYPLAPEIEAMAKGMMTG
jgi:hypothetical protein